MNIAPEPPAATGLGGQLASRAAGAATLSLLVFLGLAVEGVARGADDESRSLTMLVVTAIVFTITGCCVCMACGPSMFLVGHAMLAAGITAAITLAAASWAGDFGLLQWLANWAWWAPWGFAAIAVAIDPDASRRTSRALAGSVAILSSISLLALLLEATMTPYGEPIVRGEPSPAGDIGDVLVAIATIAAYPVELALLVCAGSAVVRYRRSETAVRRRQRWRAAASAILALAMYLEVDNSESWIVGFSAICLAKAAFRRDDPVLALQRAFNRLVYGDRDEPYTVVTRLGAVLENTLEPQGVLPLVTQRIAASLRVPYVAIELAEPGRTRIAAEHGTETGTVEAFDMVAHGEQVGRLLVAPRPGDDAFTERECRLLRDVARQAAIAAQATRLVRDLQDSRGRLIAVREEERRRLRQDLHDGLGPCLVSLGLQIHTARRQLVNPERADVLLCALEEDVQAASGDLRRLVDALGPAILDAGLGAALRAQCERFHGPQLQVELNLDDTVDALPAATELAAFRVVCEALTNITKHAGATRCVVRLACTDHLRVEVTDDGRGLARVIHAGVGLGSIRDRAAELGGTCEIGPAEPHGTTVVVRLPVAPHPLPRTSSAAVQRASA
jgi:two-component system, NarL family, sensor kinase